MYSMIYEVRVGDEVKAMKTTAKYRFIEDARVDAESVKNVIAVRVFDKSGLRVYSKRIEKVRI